MVDYTTEAVRAEARTRLRQAEQNLQRINEQRNMLERPSALRSLRSRNELLKQRQESQRLSDLQQKTRSDVTTLKRYTQLPTLGELQLRQQRLIKRAEEAIRRNIPINLLGGDLKRIVQRFRWSQTNFYPQTNQVSLPKTKSVAVNANFQKLTNPRAINQTTMRNITKSIPQNKTSSPKPFQKKIKSLLGY